MNAGWGDEGQILKDVGNLNDLRITAKSAIILGEFLSSKFWMRGQTCSSRN